MKPIVYFLRDTRPANFIIRNFIRLFLNLEKVVQKIATRFRIYGIVKLKIEGVEVKCLTRADDFMANGIYYKTEFEEDEFRLLKILSTHANFFIEVGSYTGIFTLFISKNNPKIDSICIEPHPNNFARIRKNVELNGLSNVEIVHGALGDAIGKISFSIPEIETLSAVGSVNRTFSQSFHGTRYLEVEVKQTTLDFILNNKKIEACDIVKIDVEYYELNVLKGALETLLKKKPLILLEIILSERLFYYIPELQGKIDADHAQEVESLLKEYGYFPYCILKDGVYRVDSVINCPDTRNYLFATKSFPQRFVPFEQLVKSFQS